jgi:tight adherence protein B
MGISLGLLLGVGLFLCLLSGRPRSVRGLGWTSRTQALLTEADFPAARPIHLYLATVALMLATAATVWGISSTWSIAVVFGVFGALGPWLLLKRRVVRRQRDRRDLWPYVVDDLASGIRAGLSLPEAVAAVADRGPLPLRPAFAGFAGEYRASGSFSVSLDRLAADLADPVGDRVIEALRLARDVGGTDVGRLLRTLGQALREDARARGEIEARQSWTVNGARLAVAAPWAVLLLLASRSSSVRVYDHAGGLVVLAIGAGLSSVAYVMMHRIGRLPSESRTVDAHT